MISKKIIYFSLIFSMMLSIQSCSSNTKTAKMNIGTDGYAKARSMGIEAPTKTKRGTLLSKILYSDSVGPVIEHKMPKGCVSKNKNTIAKGKFLFANVSGKKVKKPPFKISRTTSKARHVEGRKKWKPYGNCVACHNIGGVKAPGNMGPSLASYKKNFVDTGVRTQQWVFAKISDARVDNPATVMTINHKSFSNNEICAMMSFIFNDKS